MQAFSSRPEWTFPSGTLGDLTRASHERAGLVSATLPELRRAARDLPPAPTVADFAAALRGAAIRVIAEVKRASPSKGAINASINAASQAAHYVAGGAAAISVLTEPTRFGGSLDDLSAVAARVGVPAIRKDFLVHPVQLWEARVRGATAALLIVRALSPDELAMLMDAARECGLATLVEVRDEAELERALAVGATVIGVNNRNLETLTIDPATAPALIPHIPVHCVAVAESGLQHAHDVTPSALAGADAILVGSAISASADPTAAVRALSGIARSTTARR
ncbi:indole-3-glycerol phosphate synthase TrpC [Gemmatimonas sp.]|uniref:indole-3-glycerol phosphate synthase TrpC n=1 Tax=Gemmatimonas sp. TaxID=1962908 RepID=UPI0039837F3F